MSATGLLLAGSRGADPEDEMAYTVLARKYRSQTLAEIIGQDAVARTLSNAIESNRVHHGYLFTGTRGVGKTSMARILAKSLNCLAFDRPTTTPCLACESCRMIGSGEDIDVIEIDAASNTGVDNIRDLRNNAVFRPARSRFKIYIIDEVHMLSTGAFNALLKTLEEPPEHVKFILATTEIQKVPATIQSRCQRFDFRSIETGEIAAHLESILKSEGITAEAAVVRRVARLANGSMRDALSLLDQLLAYGTNNLDEDLIEQVLPTAHNEVVMQLVDCMAAADAAAALACVEKSLGTGQTGERFCEMLIEHLRILMVLNVCGDSTELVDLPGAFRDRLMEQSRQFDSATFVYMIALVQELRRSVKLGGAGRALIDAAVVRLSMSEQFSDLKRALAAVGGTAPATAEKKTPAIARPRPEAELPRIQKPAEEPGIGPKKEVVRRPAAVSTGRAPIEPKVSSVDRNKIMADPVVRRVIDLFDGSLVETRGPADAAAAGTELESDVSR
jgi:DNA polymerase-3 subunit gamma/tau